MAKNLNGNSKMIDTIKYSDLDPELFFRSYWRQKPLIVKDGYRVFSNTLWEYDDFDTSYKKAKKAKWQIHEKENQVTFIERVCAFNNELSKSAKRLSKFFGVTSAWFDSVNTYGISGIGSHFDHSDNFVIQQCGQKNWRLSHFNQIPDSILAKRVIQNGSGSYDINLNNSVGARIDSGDVLYIPAFWIHEGTSIGKSLSISFVLPAFNLHSLLLDLVPSELLCDKLEFGILPTVHKYSSRESAYAQAKEKLLSSIDLLGKTQNKIDLRNVLLQSQGRLKYFYSKNFEINKDQSQLVIA